MRLLTLVSLIPCLAICGCVHIEVFHPDVEGTYHIGGDRPFWTFDESPRHVTTKPIEPSAQETRSWCWAAAGQMLLRSMGVELTQTQIVERAYGDARDAGGKSPLFVKALTGTFRSTSGKQIKLVAHRADGFPHNSLELVTSIEEGRPFVVDIGFSTDGQITAAHSLLAYGLTYQREGNSVRILSLDTLDPSFGYMQRTIPDYDPHQRLVASEFHTIQGTLGVYPIQ